MLVVDHNEVFTAWSIGDPVIPLKYGGEVIVAFDPSKTNMAMVVGTPDGTILNIIEFSGNNRRRGPAMDTTLYCEEVRQFLSAYLSQCNLYLVGTEQAITKKGMTYHHSNMVLTEIRSNILNFFLERFGVKVIEVNNWSWKFAILPEGYRGKFEKGSKKWWVKNRPNSPYAHYFEADATDCLCIHQYLREKYCSNYMLYCNTQETCSIDYFYFYTPVQSMNDTREVLFNERFSIKENLDYYVNRIIGQFSMVVDVDRIDVSDIYGKSVAFGIDDASCALVRVVVKRK